VQFRRTLPITVLTLTALGMMLAASGVAQIAEQPAQAPTALEELDTVMVTGVHPGPALWKITWKDHTLWILPTLAPLPRQVTWRSRQLETLLEKSQEVFTEASLNIQLGGNGKADAKVEAALQNPDDARWLPNILPPDLYARFAALNRRYAGGDASLERFRPFYAAVQLNSRAQQRLQLDSDGRVHDTVAYLGRIHRVPVRTLDRDLKPRPETLVANLKRISVEADIQCATWQLLQLEHELRGAIKRANAWSTGDMQALRQDWEATRQKGEAASCSAVFQQLAPTTRAIRETRNRSYSALRTALRKNRSTIALVLLEEVFDPEGVIARFSEDGYEVEEPAAMSD
jgi:uncharacterized protein YbaP (TraB family)